MLLPSEVRPKAVNRDRAGLWAGRNHPVFVIKKAEYTPVPELSMLKLLPFGACQSSGTAATTSRKKMAR
jgi:hypothetical protein